jgi:hypothetical protein
MPKNSVTDPITDQEIAFVHLILSGTMNDRQAAEAAGLNPTTAAYTKSKPRVREYMEEHRAAVKEKLADQEAEALRKFNTDREQIQARILDRLWELATLGPAETKGSITGQLKAMAMIATIEGFLPNRINDRRRASVFGQLPPPAGPPQIYVSEWMRAQKDKATRPEESVTAVEAESSTPPAPEPPPVPVNEAPSVDEDHSSMAEDDPFKGVSWAPNAIGPDLDTYGQSLSPLRLPFSPWKNRFGRGR